MTDERRDLRSMKRPARQTTGAAMANSPAAQGKTIDQTQQQQINQLKNMAKPYENRSRDQLMQDAARLVKEGKQNGTMDAQKLDGYMRMMSPMLNASQRSEMAKLIEQLKRA